MNKELRWIVRNAVNLLFQKSRSWRQDLLDWRWFWRSYFDYKALAPVDREPALQYLYPCLKDKTAQTVIEPIYFYQDVWAFERIVQKYPKLHVDVGSHHRFVSFLSRVVSVVVVDIRPWSLPLEKLEFKQGTVLKLPFRDSSVPSVSSLCVVEHIGLGRYGEPLDVYGTEKAITELKRITAPGGDLYLSLPIDDTNRTYFNAHRAFNEDYICEIMKPCEVIDHHYVYGNEYVDKRKTGFGIACYHIMKRSGD